MRWKPHVRFGERTGETDRPKDRHRAPVRLHTALRTSLPQATRVLDALHVVRLGLDALDQVRRRVQQETLGHQGHAGDPLFRIRRLLRRGYDHHSQKSWTRLMGGLAAGDDHEQVGRPRIAAQELRLLYREPSPDRAERRLLRWFIDVAEHEIPELVRRRSRRAARAARRPGCGRAGPVRGSRARR